MSHIPMKAFSITMFFTLILLISGCAELDSHSKLSRFEGSINVYKGSLRWGEWHGAIELHRTPENKKQMKKPSEKYLQHLSTIKVKHIEDKMSQMNPDKITGQSLFIIEYRFEDSVKMNTIRHMVYWWHDKETNTWYTKTPLPKEFDMSEEEQRTIKLSPKNQR